MHELLQLLPCVLAQHGLDEIIVQNAPLFIALATVVFSGLNPLLALLGGFIFGFFQGLAEWVKTLPSKPIPSQFVSMLPYIVTLLVVSGAIGRVRFPKALGEPYKRE